MSNYSDSGQGIWGYLREIVSKYSAGTLGSSPALTPLTDQTYAGQFNLSTNYEVEYNEYVTNVAETPTISASPLIDAIAGVIFKAGASASLVTTNMGVAWPGNDSFTINKSNYVAVMQKKPDTVSVTGLWYIIKVLN